MKKKNFFWSECGCGWLYVIYRWMLIANVYHLVVNLCVVGCICLNKQNERIVWDESTSVFQIVHCEIQHDEIVLIAKMFLANDNTKANKQTLKRLKNVLCPSSCKYSRNFHFIQIQYKDSRTTSLFILCLRLWCRAHMKCSVFVRICKFVCFLKSQSHDTDLTIFNDTVLLISHLSTLKRTMRTFAQQILSKSANF